MPTSTAAPSIDRRAPCRPALRGAAGFTLIELGLVLLIISVVVTLAVPRFRDRSHAELLSHTRRLAVAFRFLQHEAILNGRTYQLGFDLDQQRYAATSAEPGDQSGSFKRESGALGRGISLPNAVQISDVNAPNSSGKVFEGAAFVNFYPDGYVDPVIVHLDNGQEAYTLYIADSISGRAYVISGYHDLGARG